MHEDQAGSRSVEKPALPVTPAEASDERRENEAHREDEVQVPTVLPPDNSALAQVANVRNTGLAPRLDEHPPHVRPEEPLLGIVRVEGRVRVTVMSTVAPRPPLDGPFDGTSSGHSEGILKRFRSVIRSVRPKTMIARRNPYRNGEYRTPSRNPCTYQGR